MLPIPPGVTSKGSLLLVGEQSPKKEQSVLFRSVQTPRVFDQDPIASIFLETLVRVENEALYQVTGQYGGLLAAVPYARKPTVGTIRM